MATTTYNPVGQRVTRGACLPCGTELDLLPGGAVPDHQHEGQPCPGSRFRPAQADGRDDVRREAIRRYRALRAMTDVKRAAFVADLAKGWRIRDLVEADAGAIVLEESEAAYWKGLALHGLWMETLREVIRDLGRNPVTSSNIDRGLHDWERSGARAWLRSANTELQKIIVAGDHPMAEALSNVLFSL